jgi:hypothetical protein
VFARRAVWLDSSKEHVDKLSYPFTEPWCITASLKGGSYDLEHCSIPNRKMKKHASDLSLYPLELVPFKPIDGPDNKYGKLHKPINANPYKEGGIKGFIPPMPFKTTSQFLTTDQFHWPSLSELNDNLFPFHWLLEEEHKQYFDSILVSSLPDLHVGPHLLHPHTILLGFLPSAALLQPTSGAWTSYSSFLIQLAPIRLENGDLSELLSKNLCCCIHRVYKMGDFLSNFISATLQTPGTMQLINTFGFNTIQTESFSHYSIHQRLILFVRPLLWLTKPPTTSYLHSKNR